MCQWIKNQVDIDFSFFGSITVFGTTPDALSEQGPQMLGTIQMIRRLLENASLATLCDIPDFFQFLNEVGLITVSCLGGTVTDVDEGWISEACDECLQTWVKMGKFFCMNSNYARLKC